MQDYVIQHERGFLADLIGWIFDDMLKYILFTPFEMFKSATTISIIMKMGVVSGSLMVILSLIEGFKRMMSASYTPIRQIVVRYPLALAVSGFAPLLFYYAGMGVNEAVSFIGMLADVNIGGKGMYLNKWHQLGDSIYMAFLTFIFMLALFFYLTKAFFYHGARWFGLIVNCISTPIVMLSYVFRQYDHIAKGWLTDTISKYLVQVYHSLFLSLVAVILYTPNLIPFSSALDGWNSMFVRLMLAVGGLHMMMNPPAWMKGATKGEDARGMLRSVANLLKMASSTIGRR